MAESGPRGESPWWKWLPWWQILRVALIGAWCIWIVLACWSVPRRADIERAQSDIAAGNVAVYEWVQASESWPRASASGLRIYFRAHSNGSRFFAWRTHDWRTHYVAVDEAYPTAVDVSSLGMENPVSPEVEAIDAAVRSSVLATGRPNAGDVSTKIPYIATVIGLVCVAIVIRGPAPVIGTRWYWFWINVLIPFGLGMLAWLALERPWSHRRPMPSEPGVEKRDRGHIGFIVGAVAAIMIIALGPRLSSVLDTLLTGGVTG